MGSGDLVGLLCLVLQSSLFACGACYAQDLVTKQLGYIWRLNKSLLESQKSLETVWGTEEPQLSLPERGLTFNLVEV